MLNWLKGHKRKTGFALLGLCVIGVLYAATCSASFQECQTTRTSSYADYDNPDFFEQIGTLIVCEGVTGDANGELLTALATIAVAAFTLTLYFATSMQGRLAQASIDLGRAEFIASHRPRLKVRSVHLGYATNATGSPIKFTIINTGDSDALVVVSRICSIFMSDALRLLPPPYENRGDIGERTIEPGRFWDVQVPGVAVDYPSENVRKHGMELHLLGHIIYKDNRGRYFSTGFCRRWHVDSMRFQPIDDPEYEYEE
ncbi:MAG TPA: hypothetical protein VGG48_08865 [Rhizomicrobium sp.]|jgi:hypothetical protein